MTNRSKSRGTAWETAVVRYLRANGFPQAERRALAGKEDKGDILLTAGLIAECKAPGADYWPPSQGQLADWQQETAVEMKNANADLALLIVKAPNRAVEDAQAYFRGEWAYWYAQPLGEAVERLRTLGWGDRLS